MTETKIRQVALVVVAMMLLVPMVSVLDATDSDASSTSLIVPSDYAYKMTYSMDSTDPENYTQITGVYKYDDDAGAWTSQTPAGNGVDGSFGWDRDTGFGPFNMFYAAINVKEHGDGAGQNNDANKMSKVKGHVAFVLDPYDLTKYVGQGLADSWTMTDYNIMLVIPTVYWYSDEAGSMYISNMKEYPGLPAAITNEMRAYAHTTELNGDPYPYIAIGVYEAYCDDDFGMMSKTNVDSTRSKTIYGFRETLTKSNAGVDPDDSGQYVMWNFYQWTMYKILSQATIGDKNVQKILGVEKSGVPQTGSTNGQHPYSSGADIFGKMYLENSWGSVWEILDNIHVDGTEAIRAGSGKNPSSDNSSFTIDGYDYSEGIKVPNVSAYDKPWDIVGQSVKSASWDLVTAVSDDTSEAGGPSGASGDSYYGHPLSVDMIVCVGGAISLDTKNGLSTWNSNRALNNQSSVLGTRLAYFMTDSAIGIDQITIEADSTGYGTVTGDTSVTDIPYGTAYGIDLNKITIGGKIATAVPNGSDAMYSYVFKGWYVGDTKLIDGSIATAGSPIVAAFERISNTYDVTVVSDSGGSVTKDSIPDVPGGSSITVVDDAIVINGNIVTAIPDPGYRFGSWSFENQTVLSDITVTATFTEELSYFDVAIRPNDADYGTVSKTSISQVPYGTRITVSDNVMTIGSDTVTATAESGYYFIEWSMIPATGDNDNLYDITAVFSSDAPTPGRTYNVNIETNDQGYGTVSRDVVGDVPYGTAISVNGSILTIGSDTVTASANQGYHFVEWSMIPPSGIVTSGLTLEAVFASDSPEPPGPEPPRPRPTPPVITYTLSFECSPGGTVSQSSVKVPMNSPISISGNVLRVGTGSAMKTIQALPDEGYYVESWSVPSYNVLSDMTVEVAFGKLTLAEISVHIPPVKLSYKEGETFDPAGLVLQLRYTDGSIRFLDYKGHESEISFDKSTTVPLEESDKSVKITYDGKSTYQEITVAPEKTENNLVMWLIIGLIILALLMIILLLFKRRGEQSRD